MGKNDAAIGILKGIGYVTVRVPRANLRPLQVFEKTDKRLVYRGELTSLFTSNTSALPQISADEPMTSVNGKRSSEQKIGVGISILGNIIGALGGSKLGLDAGFKNASSGVFEFQNVFSNSVEPFQLEEYLVGADINPSLPASAKLLEADKLYVVTAVVKSNKFGFEVKSSSSPNFKIDIPVIQKIVGGSVNVERSSGSATKVSFEGSQKLVFGVKAMQMVYSDGKFSLLKSAKPDIGALERAAAGSVEDSEKTQEFELLETNSPFIRVETELQSASKLNPASSLETVSIVTSFYKSSYFSPDDPLQEMLALSSGVRRAEGVDKLTAEAEARAFELEAFRRPGGPRILAEGDSWFAYPREYIFFGAPANIIHHLRARDEFVIENTSSNGDEAVAMLTGNSKLDLLKKLNARHYDLLLFSGGGNDIVGAYDMDFFLRRKTSGMSALDCIDEERLSRRLRQVEAAYQDLLDYVSVYSKNPQIKVITHTYDFVVPNAQGARFIGGIWDYDKGRSWMYPFMVNKGITDTRDQREIARNMLGLFQQMLSNLAMQEKYKDKFFVTATQGTLTENDWLNEIHPNTRGFKLIEQKIYEAMSKILNGS